jgi:signal transduction histidine kinase
MEKEMGKLCAEGLSFFGITNRLISHELKNVLAIISETLGLMEELVELSGKGIELKPEKLRSLSASIIEEVERANAITRNMNAFAHGVDEFLRDVDIRRTVALMIELSQLETSLKKAELRLEPGEPCTISTSPFFLADLVFRVLKASSQCVAPGSEIRVSFDSNNDGVRVIFSGIASNGIEGFPTETDSFLAKALSATISISAAANELSIALPKKMSEGPIQILSSGES